MNIIATTKPEAETEIAERQAKPAISAEERARRKAAVDYARSSVRLEGFIPSDFSDELDRRYIAGEITRAEKTAMLLAHYKS